jgi:hypothetical protein
VRVRIEGVEWEVELPPGRPMPAQGPALLLARPEALRIAESGPDAFSATVTGRRFVGPSALFTVRTAGGATLEIVAPARAVRAGQAVAILPSRRADGGLHLFPVEP